MRTIPSSIRLARIALILLTTGIPAVPASAASRCVSFIGLTGFHPWVKQQAPQVPRFYYTTEGTPTSFTIEGFFDCAAPGETAGASYDTPPGSPNPAAEGSDYTRRSGSVSFVAEGEHDTDTETVTVPMAADTIAEPLAERVDVELSNFTGTAQGADPTDAPLYILDDEGATRVRFAGSSGSVSERYSVVNGAVRVLVLRAGPPTGNVSFSVSPASASDIEPASGSVQWSADGRLGSIALTVKNDAVCESTESFTVTLDGPTVESPATFTLSVTDDDACGAAHTLTVERGGTQAGTVTSSPAGITCGTDCSHEYPEGTEVVLTATADPGHTFTGWSGACSGTTCTVTMSTDRSVTANFALGSFELQASKAGTGSGTITSSPAGINCGSDCSHSYSGGTSVTLTATPASGSAFGGWGGDCAGAGTNATCNVVMNANRSVTGTFNTQSAGSHSLSVTRTGSGSVTSQPGGISCGSDCNHTYSDGTSVTLTASPAAGWVFGGWGGDCTFRGTAATCTLVLDRNRAATASFHAPLSVSRTGSGTVASSPAGISCGSDCSQSFAAGTLVDLTATPATGWEFTGWSGACTGTSTLCRVTMDGPRTVGATFAEEDQDVVPPDTWFHHPKHGERYRQGSFGADSIHLFVSERPDHAPVRIEWARIALRKRLTNGDCSWWKNGRWRTGSCAVRKWVEVANHVRNYDPGVKDLFIYEGHPSLRPSVGTRIRSYTVYGRAADIAGNASRLVTGESRNTFEVRPA